jgi:hypothetical protein
MVSMSARICVGWNSSVSPFQTGTPAYAARSRPSPGEAPVLDAVEGAAEDARGVLHGLLVADLEPLGSR